MAPKPSKTPEIPTFELGAEVEISSDEDGFRGSWYIGKIIRLPTSKKPTKYLVEYKEIFEDTKCTKPSREMFDVGQLRPLAPRETKRTFRANEEVDAYHNDGWWEGVVMEELGDGKFSVYFRYSKEELVIEDKDLRLHREWVNGTWEPPLEEDEDANLENAVPQEENPKLQRHHAIDENPSMTVNQGSELQNAHHDTEEKPNTAMKQVIPQSQEDDRSAKLRKIESSKEVVFSEGMQVEISSDDDGFEGAWFYATVVQAVGNNKYLIEYRDIRTDDDTANLREEIDAVQIRPIPPESVAVDSFNVLDEVDAFYNDGWWVGVVAKVYHDSRYLVFFKQTEEEIKFKQSDLRPHQDWIKSEWIYRRRF